MNAVNTRNRHALLQRGWYVVSEVELAFLGLSGRAHDLLIILKHTQGGNDDAFPSRERLAELMGTSVRTIQTVLTELRRKGLVTSRRTGRASRYTANYTSATVPEIRALMGAAVEIPNELRPSDVQDCFPSEVQEPCTPLLYKEPPTKNNNNSLREDDAAASLEQGSQEESVRKNQPVEADEFDPVAAFGLLPSQEAADGPEGLFPAPRSTAAPAGPQRPPRTQKQLDTPMALAVELDRQLRQAGYVGPAPVNRSALSRNISAWKHDGTTADQIRDMITRYVSDSSLRTPGKTPWLDFVNKRHKLLAAGDRAAKGRAVETARDADDAYWLGSMADNR